MDTYRPPQIKDKRLIKFANEFNLNHRNDGLDEFVNYISNKKIRGLSESRRLNWKKDALKALRYVRAMIMMNKPIPELTEPDEEEELIKNFEENLDNTGPIETTEEILSNPNVPLPSTDRKTSRAKQKSRLTMNEDEIGEQLSCSCPNLTIPQVQKGYPCNIVKKLYDFSWMRLSGCSGTPVRPSIILRGPTGCGKTTLIKALAGSLKVNLLKVSMGDLINQGSGAQATRFLKAMFNKAKTSAPCIIHFEDIDLLPTKSNKTGPSNICGHLKDLLESSSNNLPADGRILVIGETTNHFAELDTSLLQLFVCKIAFGMMEKSARLNILENHLSNMELRDDLTLTELCQRTPGFELGDLLVLASYLEDRAYLVSSSEPFPPIATVETTVTKAITREMMEGALAEVIPMAKQVPGFVTVPNVTWDDIGGQIAAKEMIETNFLSIVNDSETAARLGRRSDGILLIGPPGCGKTLMAKALSNKAGLNFISVKGPEIFDKYLGESERRIRVIFERARACQPCLVFFDEIDAICSRRNDEASGRTGVVNMLLTEMDGLETRGTSARVFVMAATNRADVIDEAVLRAGRLGVHVYVTPPKTTEERVAVLDAVTKRGTLPKVMEKDQVFTQLAEDSRTQEFSGAMFDSLVERAKQHAHVQCNRDYICEVDLKWALNTITEEHIDKQRRLQQEQKSRKRKWKDDVFNSDLGTFPGACS